MNLRRLRGLVGRELGKDPEEELGAMPFSGFLAVRDSMLEFPSARFSAREEGDGSGTQRSGVAVTGASFGG